MLKLCFAQSHRQYVHNSFTYLHVLNSTLPRWSTLEFHVILWRYTCFVRPCAPNLSPNSTIDLLSSNKMIVLLLHPTPIDSRNSPYYKGYFSALPTVSYSASVLDHVTSCSFREHQLMVLPFSLWTCSLIDSCGSLSSVQFACTKPSRVRWLFLSSKAMSRSGVVLR